MNMEPHDVLATLAQVIAALCEDSKTMPDYRLTAIDPVTREPIAEVHLTNNVPACAECGGVSDNAYQDTRFHDGDILCEFCYAAHAIEWNRVNQ